jgi:hypothetical protein
MMTMLLPELRFYLEQLLDDILEYTGITIEQQTTREGLLGQLQDELVEFLFKRLMATLPPFERGQFTALLEQGSSNDILQIFTERHIRDIPTFVARVFLEFRAQFLPEEKGLSA